MMYLNLITRFHLLTKYIYWNIVANLKTSLTSFLSLYSSEFHREIIKFYAIIDLIRLISHYYYYRFVINNIINKHNMTCYYYKQH